MSRWCRMIDMQTSYDANRSDMFTSRGFVGQSSGQPVITVKLTLICSAESLQFLDAIMRNGGDMQDLQDLAGSIGMERPRTKKQPPQPMVQCPELYLGKRKCWLAKGHAETEHTDGKISWTTAPAAVITVPIPSTPACGALHKKHGTCGKEPNHGDDHVAKAGKSWSWGPRKRSTCELCGSVSVVRVNRATGAEFTGCSGWPTCAWSYTDPAPLPKVTVPVYARRQLEIDEEDD